MNDHLPEISADRLIFVGGLHRSGTTVLGRILADHPDVSGFSGTEASEDEGQHLQTVYPPAREFGGPGRFARDPRAHRIEVDDGAAREAAARLLAEWAPYWDTDRKLLVEKSPPNLVMGRWLQSLFPGSALVVIVRNPVVVALSTKKWARLVSLPALFENWFAAHDTLRDDAARLRRLLVLRYEDLLAQPEDELAKLAEFLNLGSPLEHERLESSRSNPYLERWAAMRSGGALQRRARRKLIERFQERAEPYGYDLDHPERLGAFDFPDQ